jgi:hypothetical protein
MDTTITIDNIIIPTTYRGIYNGLSYYDIICYKETLQIELMSLLSLNSTSEEMRHRVKYIEDLCDMYLDVQDKLESSRKRSCDYYDAYYKYKKECNTMLSFNIKCNCEFKYRIYDYEQYRSRLNHNDEFLGFEPDTILMYCGRCRKDFTLNDVIELRKKEAISKKINGLYLASDISSANVLNALPNDIAKTVVHYL